MLQKIITLSMAIAAAGPLFGAAINPNTGSAAWVCVSAPQACSVSALGVAPNSVWVAATGGAQWIGPTPSAGLLDGPSPVGGTYVYELSLAGFDPISVYSFSMAADNDAKLEFVTATGTEVILETTFPFGQPNAQGFLYGVTTAGITSIPPTALRVTVFNEPSGGPTPSGFFLSGSVQALAEPPEPATWTMLLLGGAGVAFARLRRKKS